VNRHHPWVASSTPPSASSSSGTFLTQGCGGEEQAAMELPVMPLLGLLFSQDPESLEELLRTAAEEEVRRYGAVL
jgi:hypothetical protein